jgi:hypothetical protein
VEDKKYALTGFVFALTVPERTIKISEDGVMIR